jgi:predicted nucleic acid-binding protein
MKTKEEIVELVDMLYSIRSKTMKHVFDYGEPMSTMVSALISEEANTKLAEATKELAKKLADAISTAQAVEFIKASQCCEEEK